MDENQDLKHSMHSLRQSYKTIDARNSVLVETSKELLRKSKVIESENVELVQVNADLHKKAMLNDQQIQEMRESLQKQSKRIAHLETIIRNRRSKETQMMAKRANTKSRAETLLEKMKALVQGDQAAGSPVSNEKLLKVFKDFCHSSEAPKPVSTFPRKKRKKRQATKRKPAPPLGSDRRVARPESSACASSFQLTEGKLQRNTRATPCISPPNVYLTSPTNSPSKYSLPGLPVGGRGSPSKRAHSLTRSPGLSLMSIDFIGDSSPLRLDSDQGALTGLYENQGSPLRGFGRGLHGSSFGLQGEFLDSPLGGFGSPHAEATDCPNLDTLGASSGLTLPPALPHQGTDIDILPRSHGDSWGTDSDRQGLVPDPDGFRNHEKTTQGPSKSKELPLVPSDCVCLLAYKKASPPVWVSKALLHGHHVELSCKHQKFTPSVCKCLVRGEEGEHTNTSCPVYENEECSLCKQMFLTTKNVQHQRHLGNRCGGWKWKQNLYKQALKRSQQQKMKEASAREEQPQPASADSLFRLTPV